MKEDSAPEVLYSDRDMVFKLAIEPVDDFFAEIDIGRAAWKLEQEILASHRELTRQQYQSSLDAHLHSLKERRLIQFWKGNENLFTGATYTVLLFEVELDLESVEIYEQPRLFDEIDVLLAEPLIERIHQRYKQDIERVMLSVSLENERLETFEFIDCGIVFVSESGNVQTHIGIDRETNGIYIPYCYEMDHLDRIRKRIGTVPNSAEFNQIQNLLSTACVPGVDATLAFIYTWNAFERLIAECNKKFEQAVLAEMIPVQSYYLRVIKANLAGAKPIGIADRFFIMAAALDPEANDVDAEKEFQLFFSIKKVRDPMYHGSSKEVGLNDLYNLRRLLRKYALKRVSIED